MYMFFCRKLVLYVYAPPLRLGAAASRGYTYYIIIQTHLFIEFRDGIIGFIERIYLTGKREMTILRSTGIYNTYIMLSLFLF